VNRCLFIWCSEPPEEQTDNWDDDFEEGISLTKLQGQYYFRGGVRGPFLWLILPHSP
jgi:hypothetical protein